MGDFELKLRRRDIPQEELIADIQTVAKNLGLSTVTAIQYDQYGSFGVTTVRRKFGSWNKALEVARLNTNCRINIPDEELFENLANIWQKLGRQPVGKDISKNNEVSLFSLSTYEKRFGSWNQALISFVRYVGNPNYEVPVEGIKVSDIPTRSQKTSRKINWRLRATVLIRDNCICKMCGASSAKDSQVTLHVDHIHPWSKGGETLPENL